MRTLEGIRYLINLDSAEIQQNFAGGVALQITLKRNASSATAERLFHF